jgi:hypothetical protein
MPVCFKPSHSIFPYLFYKVDPVLDKISGKKTVTCIALPMNVIWVIPKEATRPLCNIVSTLKGFVFPTTNAPKSGLDISVSAELIERALYLGFELWHPKR